MERLGFAGVSLMILPTVIVYCGPMMASKTTRLLVDVERARVRGDRVVVIKPSIDTRFSRNAVVTHSGMRADAVAVTDAAQLEREIEDADFVALDEAFMLPGCADVVRRAFMRGCSATISTLDMSASCEPFEESMKLLAIATDVFKLSAVCVECGAEARFTRYTAGVSQPSSSVVIVGGRESYAPVCHEHHPLLATRQRIRSTDDK